MSDETHETPTGKGNGQAQEDGPAAAEAPEKGVALVEEPPTREEYEKLRREADELRDQLLRRRADFDNYRKRVERERATAGQDALAALIKELVPSLDNLERALQAPGDVAALRDGVALIQRGLIAALESHGLQVDTPQGARFDPQRHQALSYDDAPGHAEGTVSQVFGKGYSLNDRLLRPALVQVARGTPVANGGTAEQAPPPAAGTAVNGAAAREEGESIPSGDTSGTDALH